MADGRMGGWWMDGWLFFWPTRHARRPRLWSRPWNLKGDKKKGNNQLEERLRIVRKRFRGHETVRRHDGVDEDCQNGVAGQLDVECGL